MGLFISRFIFELHHRHYLLGAVWLWKYPWPSGAPKVGSNSGRRGFRVIRNLSKLDREQASWCDGSIISYSSAKFIGHNILHIRCVGVRKDETFSIESCVRDNTSIGIDKLSHLPETLKRTFYWDSVKGFSCFVFFCFFVFCFFVNEYRKIIIRLRNWFLYADFFFLSDLNWTEDCQQNSTCYNKTIQMQS